MAFEYFWNSGTKGLSQMRLTLSSERLTLPSESSSAFDTIRQPETLPVGFTVDDQDLYTIVITTYIPPRQVGDGPWTPWYADYYHPAV